jgi:predicted protein tyrosine phosphatase
MTDTLNLLFVCSRNQWRSPTAEHVFRKYENFNVRSAGTSPAARRRVSAKDLEWADVVLVMETRHREMLQERFGTLARRAEILVLGIADNYPFMDPELVDLLEARVGELLMLPHDGHD